MAYIVALCEGRMRLATRTLQAGSSKAFTNWIIGVPLGDGVQAAMEAENERIARQIAEELARDYPEEVGRFSSDDGEDT
jgi:hypothetical protein